MKKTVLITGATSGIGKACAEKFAAAGFDLILTGRREERLNELRGALSATHAVTVTAHSFDVRIKEDVFGAAEKLKDLQVDVLINNAGLALGREAFDEALLEDWETMLHTNVEGLIYATRAFLPALKASRGHIINIGSIAGKQVYEKAGVYCASKSAVDALSRSMRIDLLKHGISVTAVHPGAVETEFSLVRYKGDAEKASAVYSGFEPLTPADVAETVYFCAALPKNVCINDLVVTPLAQADAHYTYK